MTARTEGFEELAIPELERRTANAIRVGTIMAIDLAKARVRVKSGDIESAWLPWSTGRASAAKRRWDPPEVGEQVVMLSPSGDMRQAVVLTGVYKASAAAPSDNGDKDATVYGDGTTIEYDRASHTLTADLQGTKVLASREKIELTIGGTKLTLTASGATLDAQQLTVNAEQSTFNGDVTVTGLLTYGGGLAGSGGSGASVEGPVAITGGTVTHNGKNIGSDHSHSGVSTGGGTTGAPT
jgi:phage baseplate assembly protein V